jgi:hypothetical protein
MPGLTPVRSSANVLIVHHDSSAHFLSATFPTLRRHEASANIVFAHALKLLGSEAALTGCHFTNESDVSTWWKQEKQQPSPSHVVTNPPNANGTVSKATTITSGKNDPFWLTVWSSPSPFIPPTLDIVLSCLSWTLGDYPIFLWTPKNPTSISSSWLTPRVELLAEHLLDMVPPQRIFSIFGMTQLVKSFTRYWSDLVKCPIELEPFYAAYYSFCNQETFKESGALLPRGDSIRRAKFEDLAAVTQLCKEFADDSVRPCPATVYFPRSRSALYKFVPFIGILPTRNRCGDGRSSGTYLEWPYLDLRVRRRSNLYLRCHTQYSERFRDYQSVHDAQMETPGICRASRSQCNQPVRHHFIEFFWTQTHYAVISLLVDCGKQSVTLYVGHNNSAQRVYDRVGFVGLCGKEKVNGVEDSLELGLVTGAPRGHW